MIWRTQRAFISLFLGLIWSVNSASRCHSVRDRLSRLEAFSTTGSSDRTLIGHEQRKQAGEESTGQLEAKWGYSGCSDPRPWGVLDIVLDAGANHDGGFPKVNGEIVAKAGLINIAFLSSVQLGECSRLSLSSEITMYDL